ncbi:MAG: hypothetical protein Q8O98_02655 [bacterium]|nr:hypothetical protein [bacterium]
MVISIQIVHQTERAMTDRNQNHDDKDEEGGFTDETPIIVCGPIK